MLYDGVCPKPLPGMFQLFSSGPMACEALASHLEETTFIFSVAIFALLLATWRRRATQRRTLVDADQQGQMQ